jgi:hypothetical protein
MSLAALITRVALALLTMMSSVSIRGNMLPDVPCEHMHVIDVHRSYSYVGEPLAPRLRMYTIIALPAPPHLARLSRRIASLRSLPPPLYACPLYITSFLRMQVC